MKADAAKKLVKKATKLTNPVEALKCVPLKVSTVDGEPLTLEFQWATHLTAEQSEWVFQLFCINMRDMYNQSQWGFDGTSKRQELMATTSRFMMVKNSEQKHVGYLHFRFVIDHDAPVLYCYELQVVPDYQNKGIGSLLIGIAENVAQKAGMAKLMATVFAFNGLSLAFFHKNGFISDETCPQPEDGLDYLILSKPTSSV